MLLQSIMFLVGNTGVYFGAEWLVKGSSSLSRDLGIRPIVIGLTVVAFGTSIPEMATSIVRVFRKEADSCVGNIIGSNIFNILMIIGSVALIRPLNVARETLFFELPVMLLFSVALIPMIRGNLRVNRLEGILLVLGYFVFIFLLFVQS